MFDFSELPMCVCACRCVRFCVCVCLEGLHVVEMVQRCKSLWFGIFPGPQLSSAQLSSCASSGEASAFMGKSQRHLGWHSQGLRSRVLTRRGLFPVTLHQMPSTVRNTTWKVSTLRWREGGIISPLSVTLFKYTERLRQMHECHLGSCQSE